MLKQVLLISAAMAVTACSDSGSLMKKVNVASVFGAGNKSSDLISLSRSAASSGDETSSINILRQGIASKPSEIALYTELADIYANKGMHADAIGILEQGRAKNSGNSEISRKLGNAYIASEQPDKALVIFDEGLLGKPKDAMLLSSRGIALDMLKQQGAARESYKQALMEDEGNMGALNNLAMSYILSGDLQSARKMLETAVAKPSAPAQVRQNLAFVYALQNENEKARKLGLKDLSEKQVRENMAIYKKLSSYFIADAKDESAMLMASNNMPLKADTDTIKTTLQTPVEAENRIMASSETLSELKPAAGSAPQNKIMMTGAKIMNLLGTAIQPKENISEDEAKLLGKISPAAGGTKLSSTTAVGQKEAANANSSAELLKTQEDSVEKVLVKPEEARAANPSGRKNLYLKVGEYKNIDDAKTGWGKLKTSSKLLNDFDFIAKDKAGKKNLLVGPIKSYEQMSSVKLSLDKANIKYEAVDY